ncbi:GGDEF domain-containing protein [Longispora sp. K20-0274]|uniref:GGDEF domain-containing protein n=1 Tax=Longispora sp. K20-0274 TaxID=3088255 RepID=UPI00399B661F
MQVVVTVAGWGIAAALGVLCLRQSARTRAARYAILHDARTGLFNADGWEHAAGAAIRAGTRWWVAIAADADGFKAVNDSLGHAVGHRVLAEYARRLAEFAPRGAVVARTGGDEFAVLLPFPRHATDTSWLDPTLTTLHHRLRRPFVVDGAPVAMGMSLGAAIVTGRLPLDQVLDAADHAMYECKRAGIPQIAPVDGRAPARRRGDHTRDVKHHPHPTLPAAYLKKAA